MSRSTPASGFTLVELLVVITIIVVLLALLTPSLDKAAAAASSVRCAANVRAFSMAMQHYALDYRGAALPENPVWWFLIAKYVGEPGYPTDWSRPARPLQAMVCPDAKVPTTGVTDIQGVPGTADTMWEINGHHGGYGWNLWVSSFYYGGSNRENYFTRFRNAPGDTPLLGDSTWWGSWPDSGDTPETDTYRGSGYESVPLRFMGRYVINRHEVGRMGVNVAFADGTARWVPLGELWLLPWHANFQKNHSYTDKY